MDLSDIMAYLYLQDVYEPTVSVIKDLIKLVEAEREEWDHYLHLKEMYKKYKKARYS